MRTMFNALLGGVDNLASDAVLLYAANDRSSLHSRSSGDASIPLLFRHWLPDAANVDFSAVNPGSPMPGLGRYRTSSRQGSGQRFGGHDGIGFLRLQYLVQLTFTLTAAAKPNGCLM
ncbi:MAG: hypothetical protein ABI671_06235 [Burkholderiales bacterium]